MSSKVDVHVGGRVRRTRQFRGLELIELADRVGISASQLYRYEEGVERFQPEHLLKVAKIVGVNPSFFFNGLKGEARREAIPVAERYSALAAHVNDNIVEVSKRRLH
jgi:transcriptional regulator with XRE-family HTH domain